MKRAAGILLPLSSLPSPYGIGTFGREAYAFVDFLKRAKQCFWQLLPLTPTSYGDSPYQSTSTFALNPYFIDLDVLTERGLLTADELPPPPAAPDAVDYGALYETRFAVLRRAFARFDRAEMADYTINNADWLEDYALYFALKNENGGQPWYEWDRALRDRESAALDEARRRLAEELDFCRFLQYEARRQWSALRDYAHQNGLEFIGDVPIYVPLDSADVWQRRDLFELDVEGRPPFVAGVPPDYFSEGGQLWGNPLYDWDAHRREDFRWWSRRMGAAGALFDVVRIDHFRGIESYWAVPFGSSNAAPGAWRKGPDMELIDAIKRDNPTVRVIAEDLGFLTPAVKRLLSASGFPGMRVIQFGFDPNDDSRELPHNYPVHAVAYTGTHDNSPILGWVATADPASVGYAVDYLGVSEREGFPFAFARGVLNSVAELAIVQMQDYLELGEEARMNLPATMGWWRWRMRNNALTPALADRIAHYTRNAARCDKRG